MPYSYHGNHGNKTAVNSVLKVYAGATNLPPRLSDVEIYLILSSLSDNILSAGG